MGDRRPSRETQKLSSAELERMRVSTTDTASSESAVVEDEGWSIAAQGSGAAGQPLTARTTTVSDPLTMALLAEVARSSQTVEFDPAKLDEIVRESEGASLASADDQGPAAPVPAAHPHLKRR